jgi:hypothetical protein
MRRVSTIDPWTLLVTDDLSDRIPAGVYALAARNEYLVDDVHKFATLARSESGVGIISQAPEAWRERSPRLRSILPTFGAAHEVRAACVVEGQCWGAVVLFRTGDSPDFTAGDAALLRAVTQPLALGLHRTANNPTASADVATVEDGPDVMILGPGNEPMVVNDAAQRWLDELTQPRARTNCRSPCTKWPPGRATSRRWAGSAPTAGSGPAPDAGSRCTALPPAGRSPWTTGWPSS